MFKRLSCLLLFLVLASVFLAPGPADAAVIHTFEPSLTEALTAGVPAGATSSEATITGPLSGVSAITTDDGQDGHVVWVAERIEKGQNLGKSRLDEFNASTGAFIAPQLPQPGEEDGLTEFGHGVAVGHPDGEEEIYAGAAHEHKGAVAVFGEDRKLQAIWDGHTTPGKAFGEITGIAVDDSPNLETHGDVYVSTVTSAGTVVDVFAGEDKGKETLIGQLTGTPSGPFPNVKAVAVSPVNGDVLIADGEPTACVNGTGECSIDVFEPIEHMPGEYTFLFKIKGPNAQQPFEQLTGLAVDAEGDIYVAEQQHRVVDQFDPAGELVGQLTGTGATSYETRSLRSIAVEPQEKGNLFIGDYDPVQKAGSVDVFGPSIFVPDVRSEPASEVEVKSATGEIQATLNGGVDPDGKGPATCQFAWGEGETLGETVSCSETVPNGGAFVPVHATIAGLAPDTTYDFRLRATNAKGTNAGSPPDRTFTTPGPGIAGAWSSNVSSTSVTLNASIDPDGAATSSYFQYGTTASYEATVPSAPGQPIGESHGDVQPTPIHVQGLLPDTVYHYRVVAVSTLRVKGTSTAVPFYGPDQTFTTQAVGGGGGLPDGRRWELVSPPDKHGGTLQPIGEAGVIQAAADGHAIAYRANIPTETGVKGYVFNQVPVLSTRTAGGWSTRDITVPHSAVVPASNGFGGELRVLSSDLSSAIIVPFGQFTSLTPEVFPPDTERGPYLRHDETCATQPSTCYEPLLTGAEGYADVPPGTEFGGNPQEFGRGRYFGPSVSGATEDLSHELIASANQLTPTVTNGKSELYEWSAGAPATQRLQLVSLLPSEGGNEEPSEGAELGYEGEVVRGAISQDGTRILFTAGTSTDRHLYMRDITKGTSGQTVQLDVPEAACGQECPPGTQAPRFQIASTDASRILFTDTQRLLSDAGKTPGEADLYECNLIEVSGQLGCELTDLTPAPAPGQAADVQVDVLGASQDGAWVYFVANGLLGDAPQQGATPGNCEHNGGTGEETGTCDLYVEHEGHIHMIATLAGEDQSDWTEPLNFLTARVSQSGQWLAFMSQQPLTGYDNRDAVSGKPDEEVYLYHAQTGGPGTLTCASCNRTGARPHGVEYAQISDHLVGGDRVWNEHTWIAANIPGWTPYEVSENAYQSRYLSDSGRLFFNSSDELLAQDINHNQDVYEYEPAEVGSCSSAAPGYQPGSGGCIALISSGRASGESAFLDASENGNDVFFLTSETLTPADTDSSLDVYDAHACTTESPCPPETETPPQCSTAESCRAAPTPPPSIFGTPASAAFSGPGNPAAPAPPPPTVKHKTSAQERAEKLAKALKACRRDKNKKKRQACEKGAHKAYGAKVAAHKSNRTAHR